MYGRISATRDMHARSALHCSKKERKKGATRAYLQVVEGNTPARSLYESLGLNFVYTYWFRVQTQTDRV